MILFYYELNIFVGLYNLLYIPYKSYTEYPDTEIKEQSYRHNAPANRFNQYT